MLQTTSSVGIRADGTLWALEGSEFFVQIGTASNWTSLSSGFFLLHIMVIKTDGTLWAWGANSRGQLGDGTTTNRHAPVRIY